MVVAWAYVQKRLEIYREMASRLVESGHAYHCFCMPRTAGRDARAADGPGESYHMTATAEPGPAEERRLAASDHRDPHRKIPMERTLTVEAGSAAVSFDSLLVDEQVW